MDHGPDIRAATPVDLHAAIRLLKEAGLPTEDVDVDRLALVATQHKRLAGVVGLEQFDTVGLLRSLVVDPDNRAGGLGRKLVAALEDLAVRRGIAELWLLTIDADPFFEALGYERQPRAAAPAVVAKTREFSTLCPDDAVLMKKNLRR